jgi:hypothetical protein
VRVLIAEDDEEVSGFVSPQTRKDSWTGFDPSTYAADTAPTQSNTQNNAPTRSRRALGIQNYMPTQHRHNQTRNITHRHALRTPRELKKRRCGAT